MRSPGAHDLMVMQYLELFDSSGSVTLQFLFIRWGGLQFHSVRAGEVRAHTLSGLERKEYCDTYGVSLDDAGTELSSS